MHVLPALPYELAALEPHVDTRTLSLHHGQHHAAYVANLNAAIEHFPELHARSASWLLLNANKVPEEARAAVRHNAGGHVNHSLLWKAMTPKGRGAPSGNLDRFKTQFEEAGASLLGPGWIWLVRAQQNGGRLRIFSTPGHGNPMTQGHFPLLVNDAWEHAYYLKHENRRGEYLAAWWPVVDWAEVARRFERTDHTSTELWSTGSDLLLESA
jgi:Fe-Mn family superoxide dismutase